MSTKQKMWLIPILFTMHNVEEAIFLRNRLTPIANNAPLYIKEYITSLTYEQYLVALIFVTVLSYLVAALGKIEKKGGTVQYLLLLIQTTIFINVFSHILMTLAFQTYSPGLVTSLGINLPFSFYLFKAGRAEKWISRWSFLLMFPLALLIHGPLLWGIVYLSGVAVN